MRCSSFHVSCRSPTPDDQFAIDYNRLHSARRYKDVLVGAFMDLHKDMLSCNLGRSDDDPGEAALPMRPVEAGVTLVADVVVPAYCVAGVKASVLLPTSAFCASAYVRA